MGRPEFYEALMARVALGEPLHRDEQAEIVAGLHRIAALEAENERLRGVLRVMGTDACCCDMVAREALGGSDG